MKKLTMKKWAVLVLVLAAASAASAGLLTLSLDGQEITAARGDEIHFDILNTKPFAFLDGSYWLLVSNAGTLICAPKIGTVVGNNINGVPYQVSMDGKYGTFINTVSVNPLPAGSVGVSVVLQVERAGVIELYEPKGGSGSAGSMTSFITIIPEPSAMALLALGGLLLRRK
ncbi:MAG TPA: PEP-CTERM sorting domain-containing protein [Anaerohalosphaeraceae bacterium]|nr:PEP-CTERM sorting domain-containing protein [Anaerohalosphaeraceae bacterium]HQG04814.1 PEP-CTERM sorting domain-containing protein [Anaerohalosphaeraceae bacterium]HQI06356.1 PEP-CTERM sorting domain-containing protein [Anaerohalosphaeraceae bacterium]HQJ66910.1 PEP-CTERM sorting domain-containing protein [Anaerohalosphaeraceae bacterium]